MSETIVDLGPHEYMTVKECLTYCQRNYNDFSTVLVLGWDHEGNFIARSSELSRKDALWLLMSAIDHTRGVS